MCPRNESWYLHVSQKWMLKFRCVPEMKVEICMCPRNEGWIAVLCSKNDQKWELKFWCVPEMRVEILVWPRNESWNLHVSQKWSLKLEFATIMKYLHLSCATKIESKMPFYIVKLAKNQISSTYCTTSSTYTNLSSTYCTTSSTYILLSSTY